MTDYNDPFEQVGDLPVFDWNAAAKKRNPGPLVTSDPAQVDVADLRARLEAATPGPWVEILFYPDRGEVLSRPIADVDEEDPCVAKTLDKADAAFIAAARNALPALLDEVEDLRAQVTAVEALADEYRSQREPFGNRLREAICGVIARTNW